MLKIMQSNKFFSVFVLSVITVMITIAFVFWGIGPKDNSAIEYVANIEGEAITLEQYWRAYDAELKRLKDQGTKQEDIDKLQLEDRVLTRMIDRKVLIFAAEQAGISVSEGELQTAILNAPYFQRNGVFDRSVYERALKLNRLTPKVFEASMKHDMIIAKMSRIIGETSELTAEELKIIESIQGGNKEQLTEIFRSNKSNQTINAYLGSIKRQMDITIKRELIS
jgi:peptidyl-prolyl cis-trans isomerase D